MLVKALTIGMNGWTINFRNTKSKVIHYWMTDGETELNGSINNDGMQIAMSILKITLGEESNFTNPPTIQYFETNEFSQAVELNSLISLMK